MSTIIMIRRVAALVLADTQSRSRTRTRHRNRAVQLPHTRYQYVDCDSGGYRNVFPLSPCTRARARDGKIRETLRHPPAHQSRSC